jgi:hypothetical protein
MKPSRIAVLGAVFGLLAGCAAARRAEPGPPERLLPVTVQCRPDLGPEPAYPDTDAALRTAPDLFARVRLLVAGRLMRIARERELTAAVSECRA